MEKKHLAEVDLDFVIGHLRLGQLVLELDDEELKEFKSLSDQEKLDWMTEHGDVKVTDLEIESIGDPQGSIRIKERK